MIKIFISHSSRGRVDGSGRPTCAAVIREAVHNRLKEQYDVFVDSDIRPGEKWERRIQLELRQCQAAVVLLDENALKSSRVHDEVAVLMNRQHEAAPPFVLAVLIGPVTSRDVKAAGINDLDRRQYIRVERPGARSVEEDTEWIIGRVTAQFAALPPPRDEMHEEWVGLVARKLAHTQCESVVLQQAAEKLGLNRDEGFSAIAGEYLLAIHFLARGGDHEVVRAVEDIGRAGRSRENFVKLVDYLRPSWVDAAAARRALPPAGGHSGFSVVLNLPEVPLVEDYLRAATGFRQADFAFDVASIVASENAAEELVQSMREMVGHLAGRMDWAQLSKNLPLPVERKYILIVSIVDLPRTSVVIEAIRKLHADLPEVVVLLLTKVNQRVDVPDVVQLRVTEKNIFDAKLFRTELDDVANAV